jgi:hypothetical protein
LKNQLQDLSPFQVKLPLQKNLVADLEFINKNNNNKILHLNSVVKQISEPQ